MNCRARPRRAAARWLLVLLCLLLGAPGARAQAPADTVRRPRTVALDTVAVAPQAVNTEGWLLLDPDIRGELGGAVANLYNFKFDRAERQFRSLRRRYPHHPMPYFLLGLNVWWKMMPSNFTDTKYDRLFLAYMDTTIAQAKRRYDADDKNYEACFFLAAAYGFEARLFGERSSYAKASLYSKRALNYLERSREANGLSPEFLLGQGLFNYYADVITEAHPWLKPVLVFFPKGNRVLGLQQVRTVATEGFYTRTEAKIQLIDMLQSTREKNPLGALQICAGLLAEFPDNAYVQREYAKLCFVTGNIGAGEAVSRQMLEKISLGLPGYEATSGRYAAYYMGYYNQFIYHNLTAAKDYYLRCIVFAEVSGQTQQRYYSYANGNLAKIALQEHDAPAARRYYQAVLDHADKALPLRAEAQQYLKPRKK
ncbi:tol-pal system protein YbgF [Hymenobacter nivis]|uniref:tol-pal system protein YbgF n=1 Tax=Hymenobacter nivis TaxID=1850093 RepID=UPI001F001B88|nr:tol-pal system protein YbgF [Hymenobacter nivis]